MRNIELFRRDDHRFILLNESELDEEDGIRSNQFLIARNGRGVLLDPGGFGVMPHVLAEMLRYVKPDAIDAIFLSHQDPDIIGGLTTWMELIESNIYISRIWLRFLPHYGLSDMKRFIGIPDDGMHIEPVRGMPLQLVPAHFLHSEGQFNVYDPTARILFSGDVGAAMMPADRDDAFVDDFSGHVPFVEGFHRRYMCSNRAIRCWLDTISALDIDMIAPQHGPVYRGKAVGDFLAWLRDLRCGVDLLGPGGRFDHAV